MAERGNKWVLSNCHGNIRELRALGVHAGAREKRGQALSGNGVLSGGWAADTAAGDGDWRLGRNERSWELQ